MVFQAIGFWLLIAAGPLWAFRWLVYARLNGRERKAFKRLADRRYESPFAFALRIFGYLVALATLAVLLMFTLRYFKHGSLEIGTYREMVGSRFYSGLDPVDQALNTFHYNQLMPVAVLTTCAVLSIAFTLVATALRDISLIHRLRSRLANIRDRQS